MSSILFTAFILIYNVLFFLIGGTEHTAAVWISYGAIHLAYVLAVITPFLVKRDKNAMTGTMSLLSVSGGHFTVQLVVGLVVALMEPQTYKITLVIELILFILYLAVFLAMYFVNRTTERDTARQQSEVYFIRDQSSRVKLLLGRYMGGKLDKRLEKLYDTLFSSPTRSNERVKPLENELAVKIGCLEQAVRSENAEEAERYIDELLLLIDNIQTVIRNNQ